MESDENLTQLYYILLVYNCTENQAFAGCVHARGNIFVSFGWYLIGDLWIHKDREPSLFCLEGHITNTIIAQGALAD